MDHYLSSNDYNCRWNSTLLIAPFTMRRTTSAIHKYGTTPTDTDRQNVVVFKSILLLNFSPFVHQSEVEPTNDYLRYKIFISAIELWHWTTNTILPRCQWPFCFSLSWNKGSCKENWMRFWWIGIGVDLVGKYKQLNQRKAWRTLDSLFLRSFSQKVFIIDKREVVDLVS